MRNQARQKLSTLPNFRFEALVDDVLYEFGQRYPNFQEPEVEAQPHASRPSSPSPMSGLDLHSQKSPFISTATLPDQDYVILHIDSRILAKIHFDELDRFVGERLANG